MMGMSRSSTCVLAYLMLKQEMTAVQALKEVRRHREVRPNDGFLRQLADLDNKLRRERDKKLSEKRNADKIAVFSSSKHDIECPSSNATYTGGTQISQRKTPPSVTWK